MKQKLKEWSEFSNIDKKKGDGEDGLSTRINLILTSTEIVRKHNVYLNFLFKCSCFWVL